ncbi:MAG: hypothetical protein GY739_08550, partial [Mesoflavibacter sp.]|nr:hypothetical protein [Mesoflavibacter sp.]
SLREQEVAQAPSSEVSGARQTKKKKHKKKKGKGRPPADVHVGEVDRTHVHEGEGDVREGEGHKVDSQDVGEGTTYVGGSEQGKNVVQQMSCFKCSVVSEQFVVPETSSKLKVQAEIVPKEGEVYLFSPSTDLKEHLLVDDALVDVDKEGRFCVSVLNVEQGNKVYVDKGQVIGTLETVENVCSVKDYLAKLPMSSNDDQFV